MKTFSHIKIVLLASSLLLSPAAWAESAPITVPVEAQTTADVPWLYEGSDVPVDTSWTFGRLENGLRYAVKSNQVPAGQVSIRVRIDAGALHEEDDEQGFAYLTSLILLNGTEIPSEHSKGGEQKSDVMGATTTSTQTVYKLDSNENKINIIDQSMRVIAESIQSLEISEASFSQGVEGVYQALVDKNAAELKYATRLREHLFQGQRLASRSTVVVPQTKSIEKLQKFYNRWYRPDKTVVVVSGDGNPSEMVDLIRNHFANWTVTGSLAAQPDFGNPDTTGPISSIIYDPSMPHVATIAYVRPWFQVNDTMTYNKQLFVNAVALQIINRRLESLVKKREGSSYAFAEQHDESRSADITFVALRFSQNQLIDSLKVVRSVIEKSTQLPPTKKEIKFVMSTMRDVVFQQIEDQKTKTSEKYADQLIAAVDIRETVVDPQIIKDFFEKIYASITPEFIRSATERLFDADVLRIMVTMPVADGTSVQSLDDEIVKWPKRQLIK